MVCVSLLTHWTSISTKGNITALSKQYTTWYAYSYNTTEVNEIIIILILNNKNIITVTVVKSQKSYTARTTKHQVFVQCASKLAGCFMKRFPCWASSHGITHAADNVSWAEYCPCRVAIGNPSTRGMGQIVLLKVWSDHQLPSPIWSNILMIIITHWLSIVNHVLTWC